MDIHSTTFLIEYQYRINPTAPDAAIINIGLSLNFRSKIRETANVAIATILIALKSYVGVPIKATIIIVTPADAISPTELDSNPFKIFDILSMCLYFLKK